MTTITESDIEEAALDWLAELGYTVLHGPDIAPDTPDAERPTYSKVILERRLRDAVARLNPNIPAEAQEEAIRKVLHPDSPALTQNNRAFHLMLVDGIEVEARQPDGTIRGKRVQLVDFDTPESNDWLTVNQFTVVENSERRPDIVLFINRLPLSVIELKNPTDEKATILTAFRQICTYKQEIPSLFIYNETLVISDGLEARIGSLTADHEWFMPWRTIKGEDEAPSTELELEVLVGTEKRLGLIADDIITHFEERLETMDGKAMIVCMSRRICVDLYNALVARCPEWHNGDDKQGTIKVVMTGSSDDDASWQPHIRNKARREEMAVRFKNPKDPLKVVIVRDMWLTEFDAPSLHTMYVDKPMRGHGLMQAIARVNRVFADKPGGLVVDYIGLAYHLKRALANYTENGGKGSTAINKAEAVAVMQEKHEICCGLFYSFDWSSWIAGNATDRLKLLPPAQEHILRQKDGKVRLLETVTALSKAFALAVPHEKTIEIRDDVAFFQAVRSVLAKPTATEEAQSEATEQAIKQLISRAVVSEGVVDIFAAAGLEKPDVSILSDEFLVEVRDLPHKNVAVELLEKLLNDEIRTHSRKNVVQGRSFAEMLEGSIRAYQNRTVEAAQVIEELIEIAKEMRQAQNRGDDLGLSGDELAFYDALETNDSAVKVLGDETLRTIAVELVETVRCNVTIDWTMKESVRAKLRVMVKRILRKYGYPPDKQAKATETVLEQAEVLCEDWA